MLRAANDVSKPWLATQLDMGSPVYVSNHIGRLRRSITTEAHRLLQRLEVKGKAWGLRPASGNDLPPATLAVVAAGQHVAVDLATRAMAAPLVAPLGPRESDQKLAWRVPRLQLDNTPLREVVGAINAHTVGRLELADAELGSLEVSGVLRVDNIDTLLTMLERNYGVRAERNETGVAILRRVPR